jgi:hypothetical protein
MYVGELFRRDRLTFGVWFRLECPSLVGSFSSRFVRSYLAFGCFASLPSYCRCQMRTAGWVPFRTECMLWDAEIDLAGCVDMLWSRAEDEGRAYGPGCPRRRVLLADWKRSKEIKLCEPCFRERGIGPLHDKANCNHEHYQLQLNLYWELLERHYDVAVEVRAVTVLWCSGDFRAFIPPQYYRPHICLSVPIVFTYTPSPSTCTERRVCRAPSESEQLAHLQRGPQRTRHRADFRRTRGRGRGDAVVVVLMRGRRRMSCAGVVVRRCMSARAPITSPRRTRANNTQREDAADLALVVLEQEQRRVERAHVAVPRKERQHWALDDHRRLVCARPRVRPHPVGALCARVLPAADQWVHFRRELGTAVLPRRRTSLVSMRRARAFSSTSFCSSKMSGDAHQFCLLSDGSFVRGRF